MSNTPAAYPDFLSSFGRRIGRRIRGDRSRAINDLLPKVSLHPEDGMLNLAQLFPAATSYHLEIGFGAGEHLAEVAALMPEVGFIGCEPYLNGVAALLLEVQARKLNNIRLFADDVRLLFPAIPKESLAKIYILFPDPWPKKKHHKRRLISHALLDTLAQLQPAGGRLLLATDHEDYAAWMLEHVLTHPAYEWTAKQQEDWKTPPKHWVKTRYQEKTMAEGRLPCFIDCVRIE